MSHWPISILSGVSSLINLFLPMVMSRLLPAEEIGAFKIFFLYLMTVPALSVTVGMANGVYFWAAKGSEGRDELHTGWSLLLLHTLGFMLILVAASPWMGSELGWTPWQIAGFILGCLPTTAGAFYEAGCIARKQIWRGAIFSAGFDLLRTSAVLATVVLTKSAGGALWAFSIVGLLKIAVSIYMGDRDGLISWKPTLKTAKPVMRYSIPVSISAIFDLLVNYSDRFVLSALIPAGQFAVYTFGCLAIPPLQILEQSVNKVLMPRLTETLLRGDYRSGAALYREALEEIMMIYIPAACGLLVFAEPIIRLLFTEKYLDAVPYLRVYAFWYILCGIPYDVAARATGNGKWVLKVTTTMGLASLAICALLTWKFGAMGALASVLITLTLQRSWGLLDMRARYGWGWSEMIPFESLAMFAGLSVLLSALSVWAATWLGTGLHWLIVCAPPFAIVYLGIMFFFRRRLIETLKAQA